MSFRNLKVCIFGPSWGPRNADDKHWEPKHIKTPSFFEIGPGKCPKWASGSAIGNVQMSFGSLKTNISNHAGLRKCRSIASDAPRATFLSYAGPGKDWRIAPEVSKLIFSGQRLSSGNAENELPETQNERKVGGQISKNEWKRMIFATFRKNVEKRAKAGVKNKRPMARPAKREKHNKTHSFRPMFEEQASKND